MRQGIYLTVITCMSFMSTFCFSGVDPNSALDKLMKGNARYVSEKSVHPNRSKERREELKKEQNPFAVIVACSDSRVAPEIIFDQGLGDLFVIRVAGNVIGPFELESILYAVENLESSCIIVMGHENCGAVDAVIKGQTAGVDFIAQLIRPSVQKANTVKNKNLLKASIEFNAEAMQNFLEANETIQKRIKQRKLIVRSAYFDIDQGSVVLL